VIVRRENRFAPESIVQMLAHRPGDRDAVVRRRAAADLVQQHETPLRRRMENRARLGHLYHERRLPANQVVACTHAGEYAIDDPDARVRSRYEASHLSDQYDQSDLA